MKPARSGPGEPPTADELLAYRDGALSEPERARIAAKIEAFPEAALALANLDRFPDVRPGPGVVEPGEAETDAAWESFRRRMGYAEADLASPAPNDRTPAAAPPAPPDPPARRRGGWWAGPAAGRLAAALLVLAGFALAFELGRQQPRTVANVVVVQLAPAGQATHRDAGASRLFVPDDADGVVLVLALAEDGGFESFRAVVESSTGRRVARLRGLTPDGAGRLRLQLPAVGLSAGTYRVEVHGEGADQDAEPVARFDLRVATEPRG